LCRIPHHFKQKFRKRAKTYTIPNQSIYLDDFYLPVAVYYSERNVIPLRFNRIREDQAQIKIPSKSIIVSNKETVSELEKLIGKPVVKLDQIQELLLVQSQ